MIKITEIKRKNFIRLLKEYDVSPGEAAKILGCSSAFISQLKNPEGKRYKGGEKASRPLNEKHIEKLCKHSKVPEEYFYEGLIKDDLYYQKKIQELNTIIKYLEKRCANHPLLKKRSHGKKKIIRLNNYR